MKIRVKVTVPKNAIPVAKLKQAIADSLSLGAANGAAKLARPTGTWRHKAAMRNEVDGDTATAGTDDTIYGYVNDGTRPHVIVAKNAKRLAFGPSTPKTSVGSLSAGSGSRGGVTTFKRSVQHPGTAARQFDEAAADELQREWPPQVQKAIAEAVS